MATISIPWNTGGGNIVIEYNGEGDGSLLVCSDTENEATEERSQVLNVITTNGSPAVALPITVRQGGRTGGDIMVESITIDGYTEEGSDHIFSFPAFSVSGPSNKKLVVTVLPEDATNKALLFESSDTTVATIDDEGNITTHATEDDLSKRVTFTVTAQDGSGVSASREYFFEP